MELTVLSKVRKEDRLTNTMLKTGENQRNLQWTLLYRNKLLCFFGEQKQCLMCEVNPSKIPSFDFICASWESILPLQRLGKVRIANSGFYTTGGWVSNDILVALRRVEEFKKKCMDKGEKERSLQQRFRQETGSITVVSQRKACLCLSRRYDTTSVLLLCSLELDNNVDHRWQSCDSASITKNQSTKRA
ncbi:hypothetical protein Tco_0954990 [Tanacetum coccineum]|uniref:Uncharacterized protein n=1 Tax=Tanacetum coccineum TaxID=301880 RepID=A0ABQ5E5X6_9ASTR